MIILLLLSLASLSIGCLSSFRNGNTGGSRPTGPGTALICYRILGTLPAPWEDFYSLTGKYPGVTLYAQGAGEGDSTFDPEWRDASVLTAEVTECGARQAIAEVLGVEVYRIVILQAGICEAC